MTTTPETTPPRMGRPSEFSDEVAAQILEHLSEGMSLRDVCQKEGMPHRSTIFRWLAARRDFAAAYAHAKEIGCELTAEEALADALNATPTTAQVERLRWDARRWHVSKLHPRRFGDRVAAELSGPGGAPLQLQPVQPALLPIEVVARVRQLIHKAEQDLGLPDGTGADDATRLKSVMAHGELPPDLYEVVHADASGSEPA